MIYVNTEPSANTSDIVIDGYLLLIDTLFIDLIIFIIFSIIIIRDLTKTGEIFYLNYVTISIILIDYIVYSIKQHEINPAFCPSDIRNYIMVLGAIGMIVLMIIKTKQIIHT